MSRALIRITHGIALDPGEISESFVRASGPGGQNVNKVASAVLLRFDALGSPNLPDRVKERLPAVAGRRMTDEGVILIKAQDWRDQPRNRAAALERLIALIAEAAHEDKPRRATRPTLASKRRRLDGKTKRAAVKAGRKAPGRDD